VASRKHAVGSGIIVPRAGRRILLAGIVAAALMARDAGAQKLEIKTQKDPKADFSAIRTYAWLPPAPIVKNVAPDAVSNPTLSQEALGPAIVAAVDRELAVRGLVLAPSDEADVHVAYFAALTVGFSQSYLGEYYGYVTGWASPIPQGLAPSTSMTVYEKGTVLVDVVHRATNRAIWRGTVVTRIHQEHTLEKRVERINDGAARLFRNFPIPPKK
jgi:Domain of unknown function (DUF4136)